MDAIAKKSKLKKVDDKTLEGLIESPSNLNSTESQTENQLSDFLERLVSEKHIDQKTNYTLTNAEGIIEIGTYTDYLATNYHGLVSDSVASNFHDDTIVKLKSVGGWGMEKLIDALRPAEEKIENKERLKANLGVITVH